MLDTAACCLKSWASISAIHRSSQASSSTGPATAADVESMYNARVADTYNTMMQAEDEVKGIEANMRSVLGISPPGLFVDSSTGTGQFLA